MMIYTAKLDKKKLVAALVLILAIIAALVFGLPSSNQSAETLKSQKLESEEDILAYIKELGYEMKEGSMTTKEVTIPEKFDEVYERFNELQKEYGFDLSKYKGKAVSLYCCEVTNHPESENTLLELLIYKNKLIGGCVYTKNLDGFMYGLEKLETASKQEKQSESTQSTQNTEVTQSAQNTDASQSTESTAASENKQ